MHINLDLYRVFYFTAKERSISKAAKKLYTSQPAVSQAIKSLEGKLDAQLFHRTPKGVALTSDGEFLFRYIKQWYELVEASEKRFFELKSLSAGQIRIAVCSAICKYQLMGHLEVFCKKHPDIKVVIKDKPSKEILTAMEIGETDIGVINLNANYEASLDIIETIMIQDCFIAGKVFKGRLSKPLSIKELTKNYPILLPGPGNTRTYIDGYFASHGVEFEPHMELSNLNLLVEFAKRGLGISCVSKEHVQNELEHNELFEIPVIEEIPERIMGIAVSKDFPLSTAAQEFVKICRHCPRTLRVQSYNK